MKKKRLIISIFVGALFLSLVLALTTYQITTFDDGSSSGNLSFTGNGNFTKNLSIPIYAGVTLAQLNLTGFQDTSYPTNPYLEIGTPDGTYEWSLRGSEFQGTTAVLDELNDASTVKNLTFTGNENQTVYLKILKHATGISAFLNMTGYGIIQTEEQLGTSGSGVLESIGADGWGQKKTISDTIKSLSFTLNKQGSPSGDVIFRIRKVSDDSIMGSKVLGDASSLVAFPSKAWYEIEFDTPVVINEEVNLMVEYYGSSGAVTVYNSGSDVKSGEYAVARFEGLGYVNWTNLDLAYKITYDSYNYTTNPFLEVGTPDGNYEWNYTGEFNITEQVSTFSSEIDSFLNSCSADSENYCNVPLLFSSENQGILEISDISISSTNISKLNFISKLNSILSGDCSEGTLDGTNCSIPFLFHSDTQGITQYSDILVEYTEPELSIIDSSNWQVSMLPGESVFNTWTVKALGGGMDLTSCTPFAGTLNAYASFSENNFNLSSNETKAITVTIDHPAEGSYNTEFSVTCNLSSENRTTTGNPSLIFTVSGGAGDSSSGTSTGGSSSTPDGEEEESQSCNLQLVRPTQKIILQGVEGETSDNINIKIKNTANVTDTFNFELDSTLEKNCILRTNRADINGRSTFENYISCDFQEEDYVGKVIIKSSQCDSSLNVGVGTTFLGRLVGWFNALITGGDIMFFGLILPAWILFFGSIMLMLSFGGFVLAFKKFAQW